MPENDNSNTTIPEMVENVRAGKMSRRKFVTVLTAMGISTAGVSAIAVVATHPFGSTPTSPTRPAGEQNSQNTHLQLHQQHITHQSHGNKHALQEDYAPHAIVEDSMYTKPLVGCSAIMARKGMGMAAIPDLQINITNRVVHGNQVTAEWVATGTHTGDLPDMPTTGRAEIALNVPVC